MLLLIGYYTVLCTIWKDIVRVCIVLKTPLSNTSFQYNTDEYNIFPYCTYHCILTYLLYSWNEQYYNNNSMLYCNLPTACTNKFRKKYLRQPSIDFDFCNVSSSCDVVYRGRWLIQAGYWFILQFCEHFTCLSS